MKVSRDTARKLAFLQRRLHKDSLDETIQSLVSRHRKELLGEVFGADKGKIGVFTEEDRGEDRS